MNLQKTLKTVILAITLSIASQASAGLILSDDNHYAYDDVTKLTWFIGNDYTGSWSDVNTEIESITITSSLSDETYSDWFLPSYEQVKVIFDAGDTSDGLFSQLSSGDSFWSTEIVSDTSQANTIVRTNTDRLRLWTKDKSDIRGTWAVYEGLVKVAGLYTPPSKGNSTSIPEPSSIAIFLLAISALIMRRKTSSN